MDIPNLLFNESNGFCHISILTNCEIDKIVTFIIEITDGPEKGRTIHLDFDIATAQSLKKHLAWNIAHLKSI